MFDDIRPYNDSETSMALKRVSASPIIDPISEFIFPGKDPELLREQLRSIEGVSDFQTKIMSGVIASIISQTTDGVECEGLEYFRRKLLLLSNHRDIVLDPAIIQLLLYQHNLPQSEIAVGDNLMVNSFVEDLIRSNRMIKVVRSDNPREVYTTSKVLSEYIRTKIASGESSIWLAHRNGRTKDGYDETEQGLLKMLDMSGKGSFMDNFGELGIMPVSISYEYEPCGVLKAVELWHKMVDGGYKKAENEDLTSMLTGIRQPKGRIHISFCRPVTEEELADADSFSKNDKFRRLAEIVDSRIVPAFKLWPNNYIAAEILSEESGCTMEHEAAGSSKIDFSEFYTDGQRKDFEEYAAESVASVSENIDVKQVRHLLLTMYANPVFRKTGKCR